MLMPIMGCEYAMLEQKQKFKLHTFLIYLLKLNYLYY